MSWLNPNEIPSSGYDPKKKVDLIVEQYCEDGRKILNCFNEVDPLHVFFGNNVDEYTNYVDRFMKALGERAIGALNHDEVSEVVRKSFHPDQIGKFASEEDINKLIREIELELGLTNALGDPESDSPNMI